MNLPWFEYLIWGLVLVFKIYLFNLCRNIKLLTLNVFTVYGIIYEVLAFILFIFFPTYYSQYLWILDLGTYTTLALLISQITTIKNSKLCGILTTAILSTIIISISLVFNTMQTEFLLRMARLTDVLILCIAVLYVFQKKVNCVYLSIIKGLSIIIASDFVCATIQSYFVWEHWNIIRPIYSFTYLVSLIVMISLLHSALVVSFRDELI